MSNDRAPEQSPAPRRAELVQFLTAGFVDEFGHELDPTRIGQCVADSIEVLEARSATPESLPPLAVQLARDRLRALARNTQSDSDKPAVLFLCVHNSGRSQMAAGWLRHLGEGRVEVFSGGSDPGTETNANAVAVMAEVGIDISEQHPKPWTDEIARAADVVVTMGCGDVCPVYPGTRYEDWELTDPAGQSIEVVRRVRDEIRERVVALIAGLEPTPA